MKYLNKFNEAKGDSSVPDQGNIARIIANNIFPKYIKGTYETNQNYAYGVDLKFQDGTSEKGFVSHTYTLRLVGDFLSLDKKFWKKSQLDRFYSLIDKDAKHNSNCFDRCTVCVITDVAIKSDKSDTYYYIVLGDERNNFHIRSDNFYYKDMSSIDSDELKNSLRMPLMDNYLTKQFFNDFISMGYMSKRKRLIKNSRSSHVGIGSAASTKVFNEEEFSYDYSKFVKKYGIEELKTAIRGTYMEKNSVKKIENDGNVFTDESWVDTYD